MQFLSDFDVIVIGHNDHGREPVHLVCHIVERAWFDPFADVCHKVIEAFVRTFLSSDELHNLYLPMCCALNVLLDLLDDELGLLKFIWIEALSVEPLQSVV